MDNKKQTAVEWLFQRFEDGDMYNVEDVQFIKHQALAMEKDQIVDAYGYEVYDEDGNPLSAEQYYNELYKSTNNE
jgi:hypothetical protein